MPDDVGPITLLKSLSDGRVMDDFCESLEKVIAMVREAHDKGSVQLTIEVNPVKDVEIVKVDVVGKVTAKIPRIKRGKEQFYVTGANQLTRRNPRQPVLPPNTVRMPPMEEITIDGQTRAAGEKA